MKRVLTLALCAFCAAPAAAFEGRYVAGTKAYSQELTIRKSPDGSFSVEALVATKGCTGAATAQGHAQGETLVAAATQDGETCTLTLSRKARRFLLEEEHCLYFHGAACEFAGAYRKR
jgi:hypothetical protein